MTALGVAGIFSFVSFVAVLTLLSTIFWILMLIDAIKRNFPGSNDKLLWILLIVFIHPLGAIIYYFVVKAKDPKSGSETSMVKNIITILLLILIPVIGAILMWALTKWSTWVKVLITVFIVLMLGLAVSGSAIFKGVQDKTIQNYQSNSTTSTSSGAISPSTSSSKLQY